MTKRMTLSALALAGVFLALYLTLYKLGYIGRLVCGTGECETVQLSKWSTLLGQPIALWGCGFYLATFAVATAGTTERWAASRALSVVLVVLTGWGVAFSGFLTYLELFEIHAICRYCVVSALLTCVLFVVAVLDLRDYRSARSDV
ncbi:MAG: vitamin K epoxide reductase family protein [Gemmatimonadetes bacterium]|nr:vitamin K epoxide reductase family protein [Gemmatimonadota bacterium]MBI3569096.1 vitamin K epoxide reductase family protein [Gemmatimonadota bacterium]